METEEHSRSTTDPTRKESALPDFRHWMCEEFSCVLPFRAMVALSGFTHSGGATPTHLFQVNFPMAHLRQIRNKADALESPLASRWLKVRKAFAFDPRYQLPAENMDTRWLQSFQSHRLVNAVVGGHIDDEVCRISYFSFHGVPTHALAQAAQTLDAWSKRLHDMFIDCVDHIDPAARLSAPDWGRLTPKEMQIAKTASQGSSNLAIARELGLCESTVKAHLNHIFSKLNLKNRSELCVAFSDWPPDGMRGIRVLK